MVYNREERQNELLQKFLKSRKSEETKKYVRYIIDYLQGPPDDKGKYTLRWVQSRDFVTAMVGGGKIPNTSTFYKLLKDLKKERLIESKPGQKEISKPGRPPVFYRVPVYYPSVWFMSHEELIKEVLRLKSQEANNQIDLMIARACLGKCKIDLDEILTKFKKNYKGVNGVIFKETWDGIEGSMFEKHTLEITQESITESDPCAPLGKKD